jgi:hypothetical protein
MPADLHPLIGDWEGTSRLVLPGEPDRRSVTAATVQPVALGTFVSIAYSWEFDGAPQEGLLLLGEEGGAITAVFVDSWHMDDALMLCRGPVAAGGAVDVRGAYAVEGGPDWGWRIVVEPAADALGIRMYNVTPAGEEFLGVEAAYRRVGSPG